jgi:hypothetical protein
VIERKYLDMLNRLKQDDADGGPARIVEPLPGWLARRRDSERPALDILKAVPEGPVVEGESRS